ncbi:conserved hypothetical protein [Ricinus communis]|uniref:Uncharacterized protein n=1 Tax=Ricinus communis TaxID=3988 RepID=B9T3J6_RICCO|nr:conserved hypothetical protein [Ricinus communis]
MMTGGRRMMKKTMVTWKRVGRLIFFGEEEKYEKRLKRAQLEKKSKNRENAQVKEKRVWCERKKGRRRKRRVNSYVTQLSH